MKRFGLISYLVVSLVVLGSIAVAAPSFRATLHAPPPGPGNGVARSSGAAEDAHPADEKGAPDFTACEGSTGLDNAVCRHEALLAVRPDNVGLQNAVERLRENRDRQEAMQAGGQGHGNGNGHGRDGKGGGNEG
jgi:hypothetical protein